MDKASNKNSEELAIDPPEAEKLEKNKPHSTGKFVATHFSGPLPPPSVLGDYNHAVKNGAERIVEMAEKEQKHAHGIDYGELGLQYLGLIALLVLVLLLAVGGFYLILQDKDVQGFIAILIALAPLLGSAFFRANRTKTIDKEPPQKH